MLLDTLMSVSVSFKMTVESAKKEE